MKILFILKDRFYNQSKNSYGLINSSRQVAEFLETIGYECKVVQVVDYNAIDKELFQYKPDVVIIEALWVTRSRKPTCFVARWARRSRKKWRSSGMRSWVARSRTGLKQ